MRKIIEPASHRTPKHSTRQSPQARLAATVTGVLFLSLIGIFNQAQGASVTLAWDRSPSPVVVGYKIYYGGVSRMYTNSVTVGNVTTNVISNLKSGGTYYFAATARDVNGFESDPSNEVSYNVPATTGANLQIRTAANGQVVLTVTGSSNRTYEIMASTNLTAWTVINTLTLGATGSNTITDSTAQSRPRRFYRTRSVLP